jgi:hypothetical protein
MVGNRERRTIMAVSRLERTDVQYGEPIPLRDRDRYTASIRVIPMANAVGIVALATYLVCAAISYTALDVLVSIGQLWFHGMAFQTTPLVFSPISFVVGAVTMSAVGWILAATTTALYNALRRR